MLAPLAVLRDTGLKRARGRRNNKDGNICLRRPRDHSLDEVSVALNINDREVVLARLDLPLGNVDHDTTLTLSLQVVNDARGLERAIAELL